MNLLVIGASGRTGRLVVAQALSRGHRVTALMRARGPFADAEGLRIVLGDPLDVAALVPVLGGQDAVISCLGQRGGAEPRLLFKAAMAMLEALARTGIRRYLVISQGLLFPNRHPVIALLRLVLARIVADSTAMERLIRASDTDWTIIRAPRLVNGEGRRGYRIAAGTRPGGAAAMRRGDLAAFLLDEAEQARHVKAIVGIAAH